MKQPFFIIVFFILASMQSQAQKIYFSDTTNTWDVQYLDYPNNPCAPCGHIHYYYNGTVNYAGYRYSFLTSDAGDSVFVRDDTASARVYVRTYRYHHSPRDTSEFLLLDYNLQIGDTFTAFNGFKFVVDSVSTVMLDSYPHKLFSFRQATSSGSGFWVIEGVGSKVDPLFSRDGFFFEDLRTLYCFKNKGSAPYLSPPVGTAVTYSFSSTPPFGQIMVQSYPFNNSNTCQILSVNDLQPKALRVYPQPATGNVTIELPRNIDQCRLQVINIQGQVVQQSVYKNIGKITVHSQVAGLYLYRLTDEKNRLLFTGKLMFE